MANPNFYTSQSASQLFPAARAMKQTSTTVATGLIPGVNTLTSPSITKKVQGQHAVTTKVGAPDAASAMSLTGRGRAKHAKGVVAPHCLTEDEVLQQKVFAARLLGAPLGGTGQLDPVTAGSAMTTSQVGLYPHVAASNVKRMPTPGAVPVVTPQQHAIPRYPQQQQLLQQGRVISSIAAGSLNTPATNKQQPQFQGAGHQQEQYPSDQLQQQQHQQQFLQGQQHFIQGQQKQFGQDNQHVLLQDQQHQQQGYNKQQQHFSAAFSSSGKGRQNKNNSGAKWGENVGKGTQQFVETVKGAFGKKTQQVALARPAETAVNVGPGILGAYPTSQSLGKPFSSLNPQASHYSSQPTSNAASTAVSIPPSAMQPTRLQPNFKETLEGLSPFESEKLRKALLSGQIENLGLSSAQALDILQALKSISSGGKGPSQNEVMDTISTNWPGTADEDFKGSSQEMQPKSSEHYRGLGSILEILRSGEVSANEEDKREVSCKSWDDKRLSRESDGNRLGSTREDHRHGHSDSSVVRLQSKTGLKDQTAMFGVGDDAQEDKKEGWNKGWPGHPSLAADSSFPVDPGSEHVISTIEQNLQMLQVQREKLLQGQSSLPGRSGDDQGPAANHRRTNDNNRRSRSRERVYGRGPGAWTRRPNSRFSRSSERDRDRHSNQDRDKDRSRDDHRSERRASWENDRGRSPVPHRNDGRKRRIDSPLRREKTRSSSRDRKERGQRSTSRERRGRRYPSDDHRGLPSQRRRGDSPDIKRRRPEQDNQKESTGRNLGIRSNQSVKTPSWYQRKKDALLNKKPKVEEQKEKPTPSSVSSKEHQEEQKPERMPSQPTKLTPIPLLDIVIPKKSSRTGLDSSARKQSLSSATTKSSVEPLAGKSGGSSVVSSGPKVQTSADGGKTKKQREETKLTVEEASKAAAAMNESPLLQEIGESSIQHQLDLLKEIGLEDNVKEKEIVDWYCYICGKFCNVWSIYLSHVEGRRHKALFKRLHEVAHVALKKTLITKLAELPDKGKGDPEKQKQSNAIQPSYAIMPPVQPVVNSTPLGHLDQAFFCGQCFRTYVCSYEEHLVSEDHKKFERMRPKCSLCNLTFSHLKYLRSHCNMLSHIRKAQERGIDTTANDGKEAVIDSNEEGEVKEVEQKDIAGGGGTTQKTDITGIEFITPITGFFCKLCSKFYNKEKQAKSVHCRTPAHNQKVKQYYEVRIKSSVASLKDFPGITINDKTRPSITETSSQGAGTKDTASNDVPSKDPSLKDVSPKCTSLKVTSHKDASPKDALPKDAPAKDTSRKDTSTKDASLKDASAKDTTRKDASLKDISRKDTSLKDASAKDNTRKDTSRKDASPKDASLKDASRKDTSLKAASPKDTPPKDTLSLKNSQPKKEPLSKKDTPSKNALSCKDSKSSKNALSKKSPCKDVLVTEDEHQTKNAVSKTDGMPRKDVTPNQTERHWMDTSHIAMKHETKTAINSELPSTPKEQSVKESSVKETPPKLVLSISKMSSSAIAAVNGASSKDTRSPSANPKSATSKTATPETTTSQPTPCKSSPQDTQEGDRRTSMESTEAETLEIATTKQDASIKAVQGSDESDTSSNQPQEPVPVEMETSQTSEGEEDEWMGELPDFDNMIFIDEVWDSDEEDVVVVDEEGE